MIYVNQTFSYLGNDCIKCFVLDSKDVKVITGRNHKAVFSNSEVHYSYKKEYNRSNNFTKIISWLVFFVQTLKEIKKQKNKQNILVVSNPPINILLPLFCPNHNFYYLVYDLYPDAITKRNLFFDKVIKPIFTLVNKYCFRKFIKIFTIGDKLKTSIQLYGADLKVIIVPIWSSSRSDGYLIERIPPTWISNLLTKKIILYSGNMGETHDFDSVLNFINLMKSNTSVFFIFCGGGSQFKQIFNQKVLRCLDNLLLMSYLNEDDYEYLLQYTFCGIVTLKDEVGCYSIPSKGINYLHSGVPILNFCGLNSEITDFINRLGVGINIEKVDLSNGIKQLIELIDDENLYKNLQLKCKQAAENIFSVKNSEIFLKEICE